MDILVDLFEMQESFQKSLGNKLPSGMMEIISKNNIDNVKIQIFALVNEAMEALNEIPWKPWKKNQKFDLEKFRIELIDIFHFLINLFIFSGFGPYGVKRYFIKKNKINIQRQIDEY